MGHGGETLDIVPVIFFKKNTVLRYVTHKKLYIFHAYTLRNLEISIYHENITITYAISISIDSRVLFLL